MNAPPRFHRQVVEAPRRRRFLTGRGQYTDDITLPARPTPSSCARLCACAHQEHRQAAARPARACWASSPASHFKAVGGLPCGWLINSIDGTPMKEPPHPILADGKVRYVGDRVALVVAETLEQAKDAAAALIEVDYDVLPAVVDTATAQQAARCTTTRPTTSATDWGHRRQGRHVDAAFGAAHVTTLSFRNNRLIPTRWSRARPTPATTRHDEPTRCTWPTRTRTSSGC
jgi:carbon-monoxide dehydrogenase large subunit